MRKSANSRNSEIQEYAAALFIQAIWAGSDENPVVFDGLFEKLLNVKDRIAFQNVLLYFWQLIDDKKKPFSYENYSIMTSEREWKDYRDRLMIELQRCGVECPREDKTPESKSAVEIDLSNTAQIIFAGFIMEKLKKMDVLKKNTGFRNAEDTILRALGEFASLDIKSCLRTNGSVDEIALAEQLVCLKMSVMEPDMYYIGNWRECFFNQHFLHDKKWAKDQAKNNYGDEDDYE